MGWNMARGRDEADKEKSDGLSAAASRRTLLKGLSIAGLAAAGSTSLPAVSARAELRPAGPRDLTYNETDHIRKYYDLARN